jgi:hypothetical protein
VTLRIGTLCLLLLPLAACEARGRSSETTAAPAAVASASAGLAAAATAEGSARAAGHACGAELGPAADADEPTCGAEPGAPSCGAAEPGGCGACGEATAGVSDRIERAVDPQTGAELQRVGAALQGATPVSVQQLLDQPEAYAGKTVRVEGDVAAMCHHRRAWFAVQQAGDREGRTVRIFAAPAFLVPPGSIGRKARAEGTVELVEVPAAAQAHLAAEHGLAEPRPATRTVVVRATGAEFI